MNTELVLLQQTLSQVRGYHCMILGNYFPLHKLDASRFHLFGLSKIGPKENQTQSWIYAEYNNIPVRENSLDAAVVPYLESEENMGIIFQELHRCLIGEGKLFIFGRERLHPRYWFSEKYLTKFSIQQCLEEANFKLLNFKHFLWGQHYFIEAQKQVQVLTPIRPIWEVPSFDKAWAKPAARKTSE